MGVGWGLDVLKGKNLLPLVLKGKNLLPESKFFPFRVDPFSEGFSEGRIYNFVRAISLKVYVFPLNDV